MSDPVRVACEMFSGCSACADFSPMLQEFIAQVRHRTDVLYEARERGFIQKLNPTAFESRHSQ